MSNFLPHLLTTLQHLSGAAFFVFSVHQAYYLLLYCYSLMDRSSWLNWREVFLELRKSFFAVGWLLLSWYLSASIGWALWTGQFDHSGSIGLAITHSHLLTALKYLGLIALEIFNLVACFWSLGLYWAGYKPISTL